ncbi:ATP phosphoribosyltransferase [Helicosporidium sp. ATCC 50920]|nr:ATP phosphoribosyltransferase [Helicosporidium sp. ATCC 50920]|eukprot:KDD75594.1 ATP phosphoribosyltransferase [Helicosporidium sp. ATCC 50920]
MASPIPHAPQLSRAPPSSASIAPLKVLEVYRGGCTGQDDVPGRFRVEHTPLPPSQLQPRPQLRLALPSKGRMAEDAQALLKDCQLGVIKPNPRQYVASINQLPGMEVWFQRASDVVRKVLSGDVDLGIVGADMVAELGDGSSELVTVHESLGFGSCRLALGVPSTPRFAGVHALADLRALPWSPQSPLRVVSGYPALARRFFAAHAFPHVELRSADGALEAAPAMGSADVILDLVSSGVTLRENNLREIEGGLVLQSQGVLVANRTALLQRPGMLPVVHELLERLDAHLIAEGFYAVVANMRGKSSEDVAARISSSALLRGLQGPTVSPVFSSQPSDDEEAARARREPKFYAAQVCVAKRDLYPAVKEIRALGGSGVLVLPIMYIFNEETPRWRRLLAELGLRPEDVDIP